MWNQLVFSLLITAYIISLSESACVGTNLIENGSFEDPFINPEGLAYINAHFEYINGIPGWTGSIANPLEPGLCPPETIEIQDYLYPGYDGEQWAELDGYCNTKITQTVETVAGKSYMLSYAYSAQEREPASSEGLIVSVNGVAYDTVVLDGSQNTRPDWHYYEHCIVGTGSDVISFTAAGESNGFGVTVDAIVLCESDVSCACFNRADETSCEDGNACTVGDVCRSGVCTSGSNVCCRASLQVNAPCGLCTAGNCNVGRNDVLSKYKLTASQVTAGKLCSQPGVQPVVVCCAPLDQHTVTIQADGSFFTPV
jgi:hypothetical protein